MRSITKQLDMSPGAVSPVVHVSQYDSDFTIVFTLYCTDGTFTLESGTTAEVRGTKKSGTGYSATATVNISAKTVTVTGHKQMTAVAGDNIYEITLYKGSKELNSINFILAVERAAMDQDTVVDETTIREFGELETYIEGVKADTAASASAAQASQTAAAASAQESAQSAIEAAQSAQSVDAERLNRVAFGSYVVEESTGPIAHFEDGADNIPMKDVLVHIEPVQAGSGDPSPDNVRPITGWTGCVISHSGADTSNPTTYPITFPTEAGIVYGGYVDVINGELVVDRTIWTGNTADMNNNEDYPGWRDVGIKDIVGSELNNGINNAISNVSPAITSGRYAIGVNTTESSLTGTLLLSKNYFNKNQTEWKALALDVQIVLPIATPIHYPLTPQEITSLLGTNNLWADTGDTEVEYRADAKLYITKKITEAVSALS